VNAHLSTDSQSGRFSIGMDTNNGVLTSDFIAVQPTGFAPYAIELLWKTLTDANTAPIVTLRWFDGDKNPVAPYGATHSNRGLHPTDRAPFWLAGRRARRVTQVQKPPAAGAGDAGLLVAVVEASQYVVGDVVDYVASDVVASSAWQFTARRGVVAAVNTTTTPGVPRYNISYVTEPVPAPAGAFVDEGAIGYRPPYWRVPLAAAIGQWEQSRQTGVEPPSVDVRYVRVEIEVDRIGLGPVADVLIDSVSVYKIGRELRLTTPVPTNQTYRDDQWGHNRHQSPHPGPTPANAVGPLFRDGLDFGDNFDDDGFSATTNNKGPHFVAKENGFVDVRSIFTVRSPGRNCRARLRIMRNGLYQDGIGTGPFLSVGGSVVSYGAWNDNEFVVGLPSTDMAMATHVDRVQVQIGDRLTVEAYIDVQGSNSADLVQTPSLNYTHFKLIPNY